MTTTKPCPECGAEMDRKESPREESGPAFSTDDEYWLCDECGHGFLEGTV